MQIYWTKISRIIEENSEIKTYLLECPKDFIWEEGSHTHFALKGFNAGDKPNRNLIRHMSISTLPNENSIGITTRIKEECSEFKQALGKLSIGSEVAIFKTHSNVPLKRVGKKIYLLSSGVGLATFRPLVLTYLERMDGVDHIHSLNIDSSKSYLFEDTFQNTSDGKMTVEFVDNRERYYDEVKNLSLDKEALFYIVGSDEFLKENIKILNDQGVNCNQMMLDKREGQLPDFISIDAIVNE